MALIFATHVRPSKRGQRQYGFGNPAGAKRKVTPTNLSQAIEQALMKKQTVRINGRRRRIPRMEIIGEQIAAQATSGDEETQRRIEERMIEDGIQAARRKVGEEPSDEG